MRKKFKKMLGLSLSALMMGTVALPSATYIVHAESISTKNPGSAISNGNEISTDSSTDVPSKDSNTNVGTDSGSDSGNEDGSEECTNHVLKKVYGTPASCTEEGIKTHYVCDVCGKLFLDENGENEVSEEEIKIPEAHEWNTPTYDWSGAEVTGDSTELPSEPDGHTVTAKTTCKLCGEELTETEEFSTDTVHTADCTNSCPCGYYPMDKCRCTYRQIVKYQNRISGPILDRIDLFVRCEEIGYEALTSNSKEESSADIRKRVSKAWEIQKERFAQSTTLFNGRMNKNEVEIYCKLDGEGQQLMKEAFSVFQLTGRSYFKILKVARTIADLEGSYDIKSRHVEEALYFRQKGEGRVKVR